MRHRFLGFLWLLTAALLSPSCSSLIRVAEYAFERLTTAVKSAIGEKKTPALDPVALQNQLMRIADSYAQATSCAAAHPREHGKKADPMRRLRMKLEYSEDVH